MPAQRTVARWNSFVEHGIVGGLTVATVVEDGGAGEHVLALIGGAVGFEALCKATDEGSRDRHLGSVGRIVVKVLEIAEMHFTDPSDPRRVG
ncbi:hypothetical protein [Methylobacterium bullatum]